MKTDGSANESITTRETTVNAKYGVAVVRPAGHHTGANLLEFSLSAFCGLNHVMTAASYLAHEGKRVLVIDLDAHFAKGSQQIALAVNKKLQRLGKPRVLVSDISAALYQGEVAKEAAKEGHLIFCTSQRGCAEVEAVAHVNWFPPAHLRDGDVNDAWLTYALLRTMSYCRESTFFDDTGGGEANPDDAAHRTKSKGPDVILVSFGLDDAKGEPDPEADCTCLGYAMMAEILKKQGVPVVFALEGGGYRDARDLNTMGEKVFPGLLENYGEDSRHQFHNNRIHFG
jgi:acetoin utilization deacetylase AcuC-like enzyme